MFARKYAGVDEFTPDGRHGWLRIEPEKIVSWDFRKLQDRDRHSGVREAPGLR